LKTSSFKKWALISVGSVSVVLGTVGMMVPVLPTTPFLLLAAACYSKSSDRFYRWLIQNRWFGAYIQNYREGRGMLLSQKVMTIALLWLSIGATLCFALTHLWQRILLIAVAVAVTIHLVMIKNLRKEKRVCSEVLREPSV